MPIARMRPVVALLRRQLHSPYPLAHSNLYVMDRELVQIAQDRSNLEEQLKIVVVRNGQMMLSQPAQDFFKAVDFSPQGIARAIQPDASVPEVILNPVQRFGEPAAIRFEQRRAA